MNVGSMAQFDYNLYNFYSSQAYAQNAINPAAVSGSDYGLSNALNTLNSMNANPYTPNLDQYVQDSYQMSQLPMYTAQGTMTTDPANWNGSVNIGQSVSMNVLENHLSLNSSPVDLNGVLDPAASAQTDLLISELNGTGGSSAVSAYTNYLNQNNMTNSVNVVA